jgi:general secretion pathway protein A
MSYLEFYGLKREPFSNAPVSQFYFNSTSHGQALTRLTYAVSQSKGLALLMGDSGAGKTTLARRLLDSLPEDQYEAALLVIIHSGITAGWLLKRIAVQLGVDKPSEEKLALLGQLYQRLLAIHESGKKAVVLIDEAQMLQTREIMEEFRGLLNLELPEQKLLTFVLFGLPELETYLKLDPPLHQRVALKIRLAPLTPEATEAYIKHRLKLAGATRMPFSAEAVRAIHRFAQGTPRVINTLCDNCLFEGFMAKLPVVNEKLVRRSAEDLGLSFEAVQAPVAVSASRPPATPVARPQAPAVPAAPPRSNGVAGSHPVAAVAPRLAPGPTGGATTAQRLVAAPRPAVRPPVAPSPEAPPTGVDLGDLDRFLAGGEEA